MMNYYGYFQIRMEKKDNSMITYSFGLLEGGSTMPYRGIVLPPIVVFFGNEASLPLAAPPSHFLRR